MPRCCTAAVTSVALNAHHSSRVPSHSVGSTASDARHSTVCAALVPLVCCAVQVRGAAHDAGEEFEDETKEHKTGIYTGGERWLALCIHHSDSVDTHSVLYLCWEVWQGWAAVMSVLSHGWSAMLSSV